MEFRRMIRSPRLRSLLKGCVPILLFSLLSMSAGAQTASTHTATITWSAPTDATNTTTYNIYRATGACPATGLGTLTFTKLNSTAITATTYTDSTVTVGNTYCYYGTQVQGTVESVASNTVGGSVRPSTITIQLILN